jgi:hypothetical protein
MTGQCEELKSSSNGIFEFEFSSHDELTSFGGAANLEAFQLSKKHHDNLLV